MPEPAPPPPRPDVRLITVSASYGAGGSVVAPALAGRPGPPFPPRATTPPGHPAGPRPRVPVPPGDRLHRDTAGYRHGDHPHRRPRPRGIRTRAGRDSLCTMVTATGEWGARVTATEPIMPHPGARLCHRPVAAAAE